MTSLNALTEPSRFGPSLTHVVYAETRSWPLLLLSRGFRGHRDDITAPVPAGAEKESPSCFKHVNNAVSVCQRVTGCILSNVSTPSTTPVIGQPQNQTQTIYQNHNNMNHKPTAGESPASGGRECLWQHVGASWSELCFSLLSQTVGEDQRESGQDLLRSPAHRTLHFCGWEHVSSNRGCFTKKFKVDFHH